MKVLVVFSFVVLGCSLAAARNVTKCELKEELTRAFSSLPNNPVVNQLRSEYFLAKMICHVEQFSHFDTGTVTKLSREMLKLRLEEAGESGSESEEDGEGQPPYPGQDPNATQSGQGNKDAFCLTLHGVFQLPAGFVCSSGTKTSPNMCGISCDKLTDDDISDDIGCVLNLIRELVTKGFMGRNSMRLLKVIKQLVGDECKDLNQYFKDC